MSRKIFGPKKDGICEQFRILHNEEPRDLCRSLTVVGLVKCGRLRWAGHVARMAKQAKHIEFL